MKSNLLEAMAAYGWRIDGGCEDCHAYQTVHSDAPGVYLLRIHHDDGCPFLNGVTR